MNIDKERIERYLLEIKSRHVEIQELLRQYSDASLLEAPWTLRGLKYCLIEIAEAMANVLQHILAKEMGEPVTGYVDTVIRTGQKGILPEPLSRRLRPFFDFRNSLIHRYWTISDEKLLALVRENHGDFLQFIEAIEDHLKNRNLP